MTINLNSLVELGLDVFSQNLCSSESTSFRSLEAQGKLVVLKPQDTRVTLLDANKIVWKIDFSANQDDRKRAANEAKATMAAMGALFPYETLVTQLGFKTPAIRTGLHNPFSAPPIIDVFALGCRHLGDNFQSAVNNGRIDVRHFPKYLQRVFKTADYIHQVTGWWNLDLNPGNVIPTNNQTAANADVAIIDWNRSINTHQLTLEVVASTLAKFITAFQPQLRRRDMWLRQTGDIAFDNVQDQLESIKGVFRD